MSKIKLQFSLKNNTTKEHYEHQGEGIKQDKKIIFKENEIMVTILEQNNTIEMKRNHKEYQIIICLEEKMKQEGFYKVHSLANFILQTDTKKLRITPTTISSNYDLYCNQEFIGNFELDVKYEVIK